MALLTTLLLPPAIGQAMPEFARKYNLSRAACHSAVPRLNQFGEHFLASNMKLPNWWDSTVQTGDDRLALPGHPPFAIRAQAYAPSRSGEAIDPITGETKEEPREFPVTTEPPGALVSSITGNLGTTPLRIDERTIYPNQFPKDRIDLYGKLVLSRPGCATVTHQVTLAEVGSGVAVKLDCWERGVPLRTEVLGPAAAGETSASIQPATGGPTGPTAEGAAERRLRQLRVLDELLEEGLLSPDEERTIRQRILAQ